MKTSYKEDIIYYIRNPNEISALIDSWIDQNRKLLEFERNNPSKCFHMTYESLVTRTTEVMDAVFSFLELEWEPTLLDSVFTHPHDLGAEDGKARFSTSIHTKSVGAGSGFPVKSIVSRLFEDMNDLLVELKYPPVDMNRAEVDTTSLEVKHLTESSGKSQKRGAAGSRFQNGDNSLPNPKIISNIEEIFAKYFPRQLLTHADALKELRIVIKFIVHGDGGGAWLIDLTEPGGRIVSGDGEADCTFTVSAKDLYEIVTGELNAAAALARGIVKISGDLDQAFEIGRILLLA